MDKPPIYIFPKKSEQSKSDQTPNPTTHITVTGDGNNVVTGSGTQTVGSKEASDKKSPVMKMALVIGGIAAFLASLAGFTGYTGKDITKLIWGGDKTVAQPTVVAKETDTALVKHVKPLLGTKATNESRKLIKKTK